MDSDGNLKAVAKALVTADEAWTLARTKLKRPSEWIISMLRLTNASLNTGAPWNVGRVLAVQATPGESLWRAASAERMARYRSGLIDGVPHRLDIANELAGHSALLRPAALLEELGSARSPRTIPVDTTRARRAAPRLLRFLSWRRNFCGDDHALCSRTDPSGDAAGIRDAVRLGAFATARLRRRPRPALPHYRFAAARSTDLRPSRGSVIPIGPHCAATTPLEGKTPALKLNDFFALNPAMPNLHRLFKANQAIVVHACATPYRERSHFDGQDLLESGSAGQPPATLAGLIGRWPPCIGGPRRSARRRAGKRQRRKGVCRRAGYAARRARTGAGPVVVATAHPAGKRRHRRNGHSTSIATPTSLCERDPREHQARRHRALRR